MTKKLNTTVCGTIQALSYDKEQETIVVFVDNGNGGTTLRHRVGSMQGLSKAESRVLWHQLRALEKSQEVVHFFHRGSWKHYFDAVVAHYYGDEDTLPWATEA